MQTQKTRGQHCCSPQIWQYSLMVQTDFDETQKLATFTVTGDLQLQEMLDLLRTMHELPFFDGVYRVLCDYTECNWAPMLEEFRQLEYSVVDLLNQQQPSGSVAFVLGSETERQIMEQLSQEYPWSTAWACFTHIDDARKWVLAQPK